MLIDFIKIMKTLKKIAKKIISGNVYMTPTGMIPLNI